MSAAESPCPDFRAHAHLTVLWTQTGGRSMAPQIHNFFTLFFSEKSGLKDREPHLQSHTTFHPLATHALAVMG